MDSIATQERFDQIETHADMARSILVALQIACDADSPPNDDVIEVVISAAVELLSIHR